MAHVHDWPILRADTRDKDNAERKEGRTCDRAEGHVARPNLRGRQLAPTRYQ